MVISPVSRGSAIGPGPSFCRRPHRTSARSWWTPARRDHFTGYLFILPQITGLTVFVLAPLAADGLVQSQRMERPRRHLLVRRPRQLRKARHRPGPARRALGLGLLLGRPRAVQPVAGPAARRAPQPEARRHRRVPHHLLLAGGGLAGRLGDRLALPAAAGRRHQRRAADAVDRRPPTGCAGRPPP